jgi:hypothetical protein
MGTFVLKKLAAVLAHNSSRISTPIISRSAIAMSENTHILHIQH